MSKRPDWEETEERNKILKEQRQDTVEAEKSKMDKKAEHLVLERRMQMERVEREMEEKLEKERNEVNAAYDKQESEKRLAAEMSRLQRDEENDLKIREQLRESSEELKALESKLRGAYVRKQLTAQVAEKDAVAAQDKLEKLKIQRMIEAEEKCMEVQARLRENSLQAMKYKYRDELLNQIKEGNKKEQDAKRDLVLEKALLEQSMRKLREEDERDKEIRLERLKQVKQEIEEFQRQKEIRKQEEKIAKGEEERMLKEYADEKERQEQKRINDLKEKKEIKNKVRDQITRMHISKLQTTREREDILAELAEEEIRQRELKKDKEKADAADKLKEDFLNAYKKHVEGKDAAWRADYEDQERYRYQLLEKIALQERLDKSSAGNKGLRSKELQESLQRQIKDRHRRQVEEWQRQSALEKLSEVEEEERMRIVEEERLRMLKTHASKLVGYLPRGVLQENDLNNLGPEFLDKLYKHNEMNST